MAESKYLDISPMSGQAVSGGTITLTYAKFSESNPKEIHTGRDNPKTETFKVTARNDAGGVINKTITVTYPALGMVINNHTIIPSEITSNAATKVLTFSAYTNLQAPSILWQYQKLENDSPVGDKILIEAAKAKYQYRIAGTTDWVDLPNTLPIQGDPGATAPYEVKSTLDFNADGTNLDFAYDIKVFCTLGQIGGAGTPMEVGEAIVRAKLPTLTVSPESLTFASEGESKTVTITTSGSWTITLV